MCWQHRKLGVRISAVFFSASVPTLVCMLISIVHDGILLFDIHMIHIVSFFPSAAASCQNSAWAQVPNDRSLVGAACYKRPFQASFISSAPVSEWLWHCRPCGGRCHGPVAAPRSLPPVVEGALPIRNIVCGYTTPA